jgi:antibiotic biosynthesis monooxygenase (ABM) superfamily enzyme
MNTPVHVAITRTVRQACEEDFEEAIRSFFADSLKNPATLGSLLIRPLPGSNTRTYGILRSFANENDRDAFYQSEGFLQWEEAVKPLVEEIYSRRDLHGLEAFFTDPSIIKAPPRWKMAILTWLGVWPTVLVVSALTANMLAGWTFWIANGVANLFVVAALTWIVMPVLTRIARPWLK